MPDKKNYYKLLDIDKTATDDEIKSAFRKKARKLHPDVNKEPDAEDRFKEINEAYEVLGNPVKRAEYDNGVSQGFGGSANYGSGRTQPYGYPGPTGFTQAPYRTSPGDSLVVDVHITPEEVKRGSTKQATYEHFGTCPSCAGAGRTSESEIKTCPNCHGEGSINLDIPGLNISAKVKCPYCDGAGKVIDHPCTTCGGSGRVRTRENISVKVPVGSHDGDIVNVPGKGNAGTQGGAPGDLKIRFYVPNEHVSMAEQLSFSLIGFALALIVAGLIFNILTLFLPFIVIGLFFPGMSMARNIREKKFGYWSNGGRYILRGFTSGFLIALIVAGFARGFVNLFSLLF